MVDDLCAQSACILFRGEEELTRNHPTTWPLISDESNLQLLLCLQQSADLAHDFERVGDVEHIGFAARPAAVGSRLTPVLGLNKPCVTADTNRVPCAIEACAQFLFVKNQK